MSRRKLKQILPDPATLHENWYLRPFRALLHDPALWSFNRRGVTRGCALGVFIAFLPMPGHMIAAALAAVWLRVNMPVAVAATWLSNPLTIAPIFYAGYKNGIVLTGMEELPFTFELTWEWLIHGIAQTLKPLWIGSVVLGLAVATIVYTILNLAWRIHLTYRFHTRRARRQRSTS